MNTAATTARTARRLARPANLGTGAALVRKLEKLYKAIQVRHPELPDVVIITGSGLNARGLTLGHFGRDFWLNADGVIAIDETGDIKDETRMGELFIAGETLHYGAERVLQTLIHEAAHVLGHARGIRNVGDAGRHLAEFKTLATEMGLVWPEGKRPNNLGFSDMELPDATLAEYAKELVEFAAGLPVTMDTLVRLGLVMAPTGTDEDPKLAPLPTGVKAPRKGADRNNARLECGCAKPRVIRASKAVLALGAIRCECCGEAFEVR